MMPNSNHPDIHSVYSSITFVSALIYANTNVHIERKQVFNMLQWSHLLKITVNNLMQCIFKRQSSLSLYIYCIQCSTKFW